MVLNVGSMCLCVGMYVSMDANQTTGMMVVVESPLVVLVKRILAEKSMISSGRGLLAPLKSVTSGLLNGMTSY